MVSLQRVDHGRLASKDVTVKVGCQILGAFWQGFNERGGLGKLGTWKETLDQLGSLRWRGAVTDKEGATIWDPMPEPTPGGPQGIEKGLRAELNDQEAGSLA